MLGFLLIDNGTNSQVLDNGAALISVLSEDYRVLSKEIRSIVQLLSQNTSLKAYFYRVQFWYWDLGL